MTKTTSLPPLIVGEVLFDHFPDGQRVLGGAPFNVAWNLQGLGLRPTFVSAVGSDAEGTEIRQRMTAWGMDLAALQTSDELPTGRVQVEIHDGQPSFSILDQQSYDAIQLPAFPISDAEFSLLYAGSLAYRNPVSRATIRTLIQQSGLPRFVDINIRQPWFDREWADDLLHQARWIKLNDDELAWLSESSCDSEQEILHAVAKLRDRHGGESFFVTCGAKGAAAIDERGEGIFAQAPQPQPLVDAVGAGDAFAAATIFGVVHGWDLDRILQTAVGFASRTCSIQGATTDNQDHYQL
jgi:fructokinase